MRQVYLAATGMNRGKTTFALGLLAALMERGLVTAFTKPVGQRYAIVDGIPADEDAILVRAAFGLTDPYELMSPVHIPRGFTNAFIRGDIVEDLGARIEAAHARLVEGREALLIEGTGHAGVGAVIGLSNADVAARLGAPALIVSEAGVGRPIDEIVLNAALFAQHGVPLAGAIVNKVDLGADPSLAGLLRQGLARHGIELLGVLPYRPILAHPTLAMLLEQLHGELLHPGDDLDRAIEHVALGDMQPGHLLGRIGPGTLLILPGDRRDVITAAVTAHGEQQARQPRSGPADPAREPSPKAPRHAGQAAVSVAGMIFTGGIRPHRDEIDALRRAGIFTYLMDDPTYEVAYRVHGLLVKTHPANLAKIEEIKRLVIDHFDVDGLLERLDGLEHGTQRSPPARVSRARRGHRGSG
jgi:BioD-like phosphotransacetylase family protein